jgi:hypothetical protein
MHAVPSLVLKRPAYRIPTSALSPTIRIIGTALMQRSIAIAMASMIEQRAPAPARELEPAWAVQPDCLPG